MAPIIDGKVQGDAAWSGVVPAENFWQIKPDEGQPATQRTEVFVGFTDAALYVGVIAYDDDPDGVIVTDSRRDSGLNDTDAFLFIIDGLLDRQNGYVFGTNAAGMEYDGQVTQEGTGGPFGGGGFNRNLYRVSEAGTLTNVAPPKQRNLKLTPYVLGRARRGGLPTGTESDSDVGFDVKYSLTPSLTLDLTYNTDFAQVEVDDEQVNLNRFNLFFPEKRPHVSYNGFWKFDDFQETGILHVDTHFEFRSGTEVRTAGNFPIRTLVRLQRLRSAVAERTIHGQPGYIAALVFVYAQNYSGCFGSIQ